MFWKGILVGNYKYMFKKLGMVEQQMRGISSMLVA